MSTAGLGSRPAQWRWRTASITTLRPRTRHLKAAACRRRALATRREGLARRQRPAQAGFEARCFDGVGRRHMIALQVGSQHNHSRLATSTASCHTLTSQPQALPTYLWQFPALKAAMRDGLLVVQLPGSGEVICTLRWQGRSRAGQVQLPRQLHSSLPSPCFFLGTCPLQRSPLSLAP